MAVYKRSYTAYQGPYTREWLRFTIVSRFALKTAFEGKLTTALFTLCFVPQVVALAFIYLGNNLDALGSVAPGLAAAQFMKTMAIDDGFFWALVYVENILTFCLVSLVGPGLVSPDLANHALSIYLSRPFSRAEYVGGKLGALLTLTSVVTWIPAGLLIAVQTNLAGWAWLASHKRVVVAVMLGSWLWILTVSLMALAISAWVKWKTVAIPALFGVFLVAGAFGKAANAILDLDPRWGALLDMSTAMAMVWDWLALGQSRYLGAGGSVGLPAWAALLVLLSGCALSLALLAWKIRASSVVRG